MAVSHPSPGTRGGSTPAALQVCRPALAGRESELRSLTDVVRRSPALAVVEGVPGAGKSRLVEELLRGNVFAGRRVLLGHCHRLREPFPLGGMLEALRGASADPPTVSMNPIVGALSALLPELAGWLPDAPPALSDRRAERHRTFRAIAELLAVLGPTVVVLEDLQWADSASIELLEFLVCQLPADTTLVLTYRRHELEPNSGLLDLASHAATSTATAIVNLTPLARADVHPLVSSMLPADEASDELSDIVFERTGGNPFAAEQLVRLLAETGELTIDHGCYRISEAGTHAVPP